MTDAEGSGNRSPRILVTLPDVAWPVDGGKRLRCSGVLRGLAEAGTVDVAVLFSSAPDRGAPVPPDVDVARWMRLSPPARGRLAGVAASALRAVPVHVGAQHWGPVAAELAGWAADGYDLVWFGGLDHAQALHPVLGPLLPEARWVVDCDDVETEKWRAYLAAGSGGKVERLQRRVELPLWQRIQVSVAGWADSVVVCSDLDAERFGHESTTVVPNTYPEPERTSEWRSPDPTSPVLLLIANWETDQNVDAGEWAAREVLPAVRARVPGARLRLVGRAPERIAHLAAEPGVDLVGAVDDVAQELSSADVVVVVPMRYGGGTRLKVLEAFAHRRPVISTTLGSEGTGAVDGVHLLLRDDAAGFAEAVEELTATPALAAGLVEAGESLYAARFRPRAAAGAVRTLVTALLG